MPARRKSSSRPAKSAARRSRGKLAPARERRGLAATEVALPLDEPEVAALAAQINAAGGAALGAYRDPLGGRPLVVASLPLTAVQPTPFQRDLSPTHTKRLAAKIDEAGAFLDPLIVVRGADGGLWTPNGRHRLAAAKVLGLRQITALVSPDESLAYRILALNTEKAHNLKDKSLEVIRMARSLAKRDGAERESKYAAEFEAPELLTLGIVYERNPRFGGGAYSPFLKKVDRFGDRPLATSAARSRCLGCAAGRDRRGGQAHRRETAGAGAEIALPAQLRGRAHQPGALPQGEEGRHDPADDRRAGAHPHDGGGEALRHEEGVERRPCLGRRRGGVGGLRRSRRIKG